MNLRSADLTEDLRRYTGIVFVRLKNLMPEVILCRYCKQPINKETDAYVRVRKETETHPEELAHAACEQKRPAGFGFEEWMRGFPWRNRS